MFNTKTVSMPELLWVLTALLGIVFSGWSIWYIGRAFTVVLEGIRLKTAKMFGPRFNFTGGTLVAMFLFLLGWCVFLVPGVISAGLPPTSLDPDRQFLADFNVLSLVVGQIIFMLAQGMFLLAWIVTTHTYVRRLGGSNDTIHAGNRGVRNPDYRDRSGSGST